MSTGHSASAEDRAAQIVKNEIDIALAEFNALRAEIGIRMTVQSALIGVGLTALGVIVGLVVKEDGDSRLLLAIPPLAATVNILAAIENRQVREIGRYIKEELWTFLDCRIREAKLSLWEGSQASRIHEEKLPSWEATQAKRVERGSSFLRGVLDFATTGLFAAAGIVPVFDLWGDNEVVDLLLAVAVGLTVVAIAAPIWLREPAVAKRRLLWGAALVAAVLAIAAPLCLRDAPTL